MTARSRVRKALIRILVIASTCALAAVLAVALPSQQLPAQAADLRGFDAGYIISDALFYDSGTMSSAAIQTFLVEKGSSCVATSGRTCLKDYRETTPARAADTLCTVQYPGAAKESSAQIIFKVARSCGINPQVLVVMLQKEQGLVRSSAGGRAAVEYRSAMGFGCPDTAACDTKYYGFFNQVYSAAQRFQYYAKNPTRFAHVTGLLNQVRYNPNAACGGSPVLIKNQATVNLYNYTPYQPNASALTAGYGTGDSCAAYGNRNFWNYFTDWFGPTTQRVPFGSLDAATTSPGVISVRGWALDPDTAASIQVHVYVDGKPRVSLAATGSRPDVGRLHRRGDNHGFSGSVRAAVGARKVCVYAIDSAGGSNRLIACRTVNVTNEPPTGHLDAVTSVEGRIVARGWALDPDTAAPISIHVYVDGKATRSVVANIPRADIGRKFGKGPNHGFSTSVNALVGTRQVCVYAIDSSGGVNRLIGCKSVDVTNRPPVGALETLTSGMEQFTASGWVLDPDTTNPITANLYVDGTKVQALTASTPRPDVGRSHGKGDNHGYQTTLSALPGKHEVCIDAIDSWGGASPRLACSTIDVNATAFGAVDSIVGTTGKITVRGWALDPNTPNPIRVHIYTYGKAVQALVADTYRPDVGRIHGQGDNHGFSGTVNASAGTHPVCIYAIDSWKGSNPLIECRSVRVP